MNDSEQKSNAEITQTEEMKSFVISQEDQNDKQEDADE